MPASSLQPDPDVSKQRILVTGGAGFIGSHLCDALLTAGHAVLCLDDFSLGKPSNVAHLHDRPGFKLVQADLLSPTEVKAALDPAGPFDVVFHLAANSDIARGSEDPQIDLRRTFLTTDAVLQSMQRNGIGQLVFASSSAIYGEHAAALHEDSGPLRPASYYGAAKLASEAFISASVACRDIRAWVVRFPNVVGPRCTHGAVYDFINKLERDPTRLVVLGNGRQTKPYLYVGDLVAAMLFIWQRDPGPLAAFNVGVDSSTTVARIAEIVREEMGLSGAEIAYTGGERGWKGDVPRFQYDLSRVHALGWRATYTSDEAVRRSVRAELELRRSRR